MTSTISTKSPSEVLDNFAKTFDNAIKTPKTFGKLPNFGEITELAIATPKGGIYSFASKPKEVYSPRCMATYG